jgi:hypothetical protein
MTDENGRLKVGGSIPLVSASAPASSGRILSLQVGGGLAGELALIEHMLPKNCINPIKYLQVHNPALLTPKVEKWLELVMELNAQKIHEATRPRYKVEEVEGRRRRRKIVPRITEDGLVVVDG